MKKIICLSLVFIAVLIVLSFNTVYNEKNTFSTPMTINPNDSFLIGAFDMGWYHQFYENSDLGFNIWQTYINNDIAIVNGKPRAIPTGWMFIDTACRHDSLFTDKSLYQSQVAAVITRNKNYGYMSLIERPKLEYLIRSQRSIYQCENVPADYSNNTEWWYAFDNHLTGEGLPDSGAMVMKCDISYHSPGYVDSNIRAKYEQTAKFGQNSLYADYNYLWHIKPRIRIPQGLNDTVKVCRIEVINFDGDTALKKVITVRNFYNNNGNYYGQYEEIFNWWSNTDSLIIDGDTLVNQDTSIHDNHFDIKVYWYGECDMWLDYVKIETDVANDLFNGDRNDWIQDEAQYIGGTEGAYRFWVDEPDVNMLPSVYYLQRKIKGQYNPNTPMLITEYSAQYTPNWWIGKVGQTLYEARMDSLNNNEIVSASYPLRGYHLVPDILQSSGFNREQGLLGVPADRNKYEDTLQQIYYDGENGLIDSPLMGLQYAKEHNKRFIFVPQLHLYLETFTSTNINMHREPTNEEIESMVNIMVSYGATGILYFEYGAWGNFTDPFFCRGLHSYDENHNPVVFPRHENVYHQDKWAKVVEVDKKLKKWGKYLVKFNNNQSQSYRYHNSTERSNLLNNTFFNEINSYSNGVYCPNSSNEENDPVEKRYLQVAILKNDSDTYNKYFMLVNRRSSPGDDACSGIRDIKIKLDSMSSAFSAFNNWKIINLYNDSLICTFNKQISNTIDLGWYTPGEARLYKIVPVMQDGGTFVCDEYISCVVNCDSTVFNNGYDLSINNGSRINFAGIGKIIMNGGGFYSGLNPSTPTYVEFKGNGGSWEGISLTECSEIQIDNNVFNNVGSTGSQTEISALSLQNCFDFYINNSTFNLTTTSDGIDILYNNNGDPTWGDAVVYNCTFNLSHGSPTGISVVSVGGLVAPIRIGNNKFFNTSSENPSAILIDNISGGVLQSNFIHNFKESVIAMSSTMDFYNNTIYSNKNESKGICGLSGSYLNLRPTSQYFTGGSNKITTPFEKSKNIDVDGSYFALDEGYNIFNITLSYTDSLKPYHLYGFFNGTEQDLVYATYNCFQVDTVNGQIPRQDVRWEGSGNPVNFQFQNYSCIDEEQEDFMVFTYPGCLNDTVYLRGGGEGGAFNEQLPMYNVQFKNSIKALFNFPVSAFDLMKAISAIPNSEQTINYKSVCDSISINLRKRNYIAVENRCKYLLTNYPDSIKSIDLISKLYLASLSLDSNGKKINPLKSFYETLILNNQGKQSLINRAFYFIQKCKVVLKQYTTAMQGFNTIMQQNPYSYEGLVASWDYAATHLLDSLNGHGGGLPNVQLQMYNVQLEEQENENTEIIIDKTFNNLDSNKFSKQDRKVIVTNVNDALKTSKQKQIEKVDALQKKSISGDNEAKKQLKVLKTINETVKPKKPNTVFELKKVISNDIKKVFKKIDFDEKGKQNVLPQTYNLSQNYPNPFNPITKINYELPKDGKVKLVIYDILGREIKTLVNELKQAGRYTIEFNGTQFASGVYFYRIQVEGGKTYTSVKKMVLIK